VNGFKNQLEKIQSKQIDISLWTTSLLNPLVASTGTLLLQLYNGGNVTGAAAPASEIPGVTLAVFSFASHALHILGRVQH